MIAMLSILDGVFFNVIPKAGFGVTEACVILLLIVAVTWLIQAIVSFKLLQRKIDKLPGPSARPILGNSKLGGTQAENFQRAAGNSQIYREGLMRIWIGFFPMIVLTAPETIEPIVSSTVELRKGQDYDFVKDWLGEGLITTSNENRWFHHRRLLTPAFHFRILEEFLTVMNEQADVLVRKLKPKATGKTFKIFNYIKLCTLDIICETAMGQSVKAQENEDSEYVQAVSAMTRNVITRGQIKPWLRIYPIYRLSSMYEENNQIVKVLKSFTNKVIQEKKAKLSQKQETLSNSNEGSKKRVAFLDLVLSTKNEDGSLALTDAQIQEEVDTFMFAGHDTTTAGINWVLFLLGHYPDIQEKVYEELHEIFGDSDRHANNNDLRQMKYLECVIKESQRLYPSVPIVARKLKNTNTLGNYEVPGGTTIAFMIYALHHNPRVWPDPEKFDPERFRPENTVGRHPYAFIPFSAGPRNCIGQKFALNEEKVVISALVRNFKFKSMTKRDEVKMVNNAILVNLDEFPVQMTIRNS